MSSVCLYLLSYSTLNPDKIGETLNLANRTLELKYLFLFQDENSTDYMLTPGLNKVRLGVDLSKNALVFL